MKKEKFYFFKAENTQMGGGGIKNKLNALLRNKRNILFIVGGLILLIGVSYAYFTASSNFKGVGTSTKGEVTSYAGTDLITTGILEFNDTGILPGHENISSIEVNAKSGEDGTNVIYNLIWNGTNSMQTPLTYTVYKTDSKIDTSVTCNRKTEAFDGETRYFEECAKTNIEALGGIVGSGTIPGNIEEDTKITLVINEEIVASKAGTKVYYYVILEYPNLEEPQNSDMGGSFNGVVTTEILGEKEMPIVQVTSVEYTEATNGWYSSVTISANASNSNNSVSAINSCITTDEECTPQESRSIRGVSTTVTLNESNSKEQRVCFQGIDKKGIKGKITCSEGYLIDNTSTTTSITLNDSSVLGNNNWYKNVTLDIKGNNNISGINSIKYCVTELDTCEPITVLNGTSIELDSSKIAQRVCAVSTSTAGAVSGIECSDLYNVDKETPTIELSENIIAGSNGWSTSAKITASASDEVSGVTGILYCTTTGETCNPKEMVSATTYEFVMEDNTESTRVCFKSVDITGNISDTKCSGLYKVDSGAPTNNSIVINSNAESTTSTDVTLTLSSTGASEMCISNTTNCTSWEEYITSKSYSLDSALGTKTIYAYFKDNAGNVSSVVSDTIKLHGLIASMPTQNNTLTYTGSSQSPTWSSTTNLDIGGTTSGVYAGSYNATFTPKENYEWSDGTTSSKSVNWSIGKAEGSITVSPTSLTLYVGDTSSIIVTRSGDGVISASSNNGNATVSVSGTTVTVTGKASGSASITINVAESTNYKATSKIVNISILKPITVTELLAKHTAISMPSITAISTDSSNSLYTTTDDDGTSYVFRGNPSNNWVQFGGFYWRIIRINGDRTIRLIYNGTSATSTGTETHMVLNGVDKFAYNTARDDNAYMGFMYGTVGASSYATTHANINSSNVKLKLEEWYNSNLINYASYIDVNAGFCNDRRTVSNSGYGTAGYSAIKTGYAPWSRLYANYASKATQTPSLKCTNASNDLFTVKTATKGNKKLSVPVGLITSDEVIYAGAYGFESNTGYYLYTNQNYWTMSPVNFSDNKYAYMYYVNSRGYPYLNAVTTSYGVRPVINLRSDISLAGIGTSNDPYRVS